MNAMKNELDEDELEDDEEQDDEEQDDEEQDDDELDEEQDDDELDEHVVVAGTPVILALFIVTERNLYPNAMIIRVNRSVIPDDVRVGESPIILRVVTGKGSTPVVGAGLNT